MDNLLAKTNGTYLIQHSRAVSKIAALMGKKLNLKDIYIDLIVKAALLHDIGKTIESFQNWVRYSIEDKNHIPHQEVSWAVARVLLTDVTDSHVLHAIYWHHAKKMSQTKGDFASEIIQKLSETDKAMIIRLFNHLMETNHTVDDLTKDVGEDKYPPYYLNKPDDIKHYDAIRAVIGACVVSADRFVSEMNNCNDILSDDKLCENIVNDILETNGMDYIFPPEYDRERFEKQEAIVNDVFPNKTSIVKAPAGSGKTIIGLMSWLKERKGNSNRRLYWVTPRNVVTLAVYNTILKDLEALKIDASVELFLTGVQVTSNKNIEPFSADIVVTNIDNLLTPYVNNSVKKRMFGIMGGLVIFDEFHEFISEDAYFSCFVNLMKARNIFTNSKTILLSATPSIMNFLWDTLDNKTKILPNVTSHYDAQHSQPYTINFVEELSCAIPEDNHVFATNAISTTQRLTINKKYPLITHSKYLPDDKIANVQAIMDRYGKNPIIYTKEGVMSAPILRAAMDISFYILTLILSSPESFLQLIGRLNRWGEYVNAVINVITKISDNTFLKAENAAINLNYTTRLRNLWMAYLNVNINPFQTYTLDQLYLIYNNFNLQHQRELREFIMAKYVKSVQNLSTIEAAEYKSGDDAQGKSKETRVTKLRDNGRNRIYCIYPIYNTDQFCDPFQVDVETSDVDLEGSENQLIIAVKSLLKDERFEYNAYRIYKNQRAFTRNRLLSTANNIKTPYICFHKVYHPVYGLINVDYLKNVV